MFTEELKSDAEGLMLALRQRRLRIATAESCTGGLIAAVLTDGPGASDVFDRGFVTYSIAAKMETLGVTDEAIACFGAVSREVAEAMAAGVLAQSRADVSVAVTGLAGPGGGTALKPVGLVHIAAARRGGAAVHEECRFGSVPRSGIREQAARAALTLVRRLIEAGEDTA